ncbi:MAG: DUF885 domain-containing protein [Hyphomonadaceae bacterium]
MRNWIAAGLLAVVAACSPAEPPKAAAPTAAEIAIASADINTWFDAQYEQELQMSPISLTVQGRKDKYGELDDMSEAAQDKHLAWRRASVAEMKAKFDPNKLNEEAHTSFDVWAQALDSEEKGAKFRRAPYIFVKDGPQAFLPQIFMNFHTVEEKSDMEAYVSRLNQVNRAMGQILDQAKAAAAVGNHAPRFSYDMALGEAKNVITGAPFGAGKDTPLWADAKTKIKGLVDAKKVTADEGKALQAAAEKALKESVKPAYDSLIAWLTEDRKNTPEQAQGASQLMKEGAAYYNTALELQTTTTMTADEIHELGLKEVARIHGEMEKIKEQVGFKGTLNEFFTFMRTAPQFILPDTDAGRDQYIKLADGYLTAMKAKLPEYFGKLPKADLIVKRVEAFREEKGGAQHYFPGTPDGSRPGVFYAHLSDMKAMPTYLLEAIAYHEGVPGHHMQISIAQELKDIPKFRTQYGYTAYVEGWGLYSEALAKDMGFYTDPYSNYGRLSAEIWRAIRLVVDTGIHSKGWTEEQGVKYFTENSSIAEAAIKSEVRRYIVWPGQATCYKIGMIKIQELRALAQKELGDKFTYAGFHDTVLGGGALPLPVLEARVKRWIEATNTKA